MKQPKFMKTVLAAAALAVAALTGTSTPTQAQGLIEEIAQRGQLRVGLSTFVPWAMRDKAGELIGFEVDVARKLAEDMGVEVEFVPTAWGGIVPALLLIGILVVLIRRGSEGPGLLRQIRIGRDERPFICYKLRTMAVETQDRPSHETELR